MRARRWAAEEVVDPVGDPVAQRVLEVMGLLVGIGPSEPDHLGEQPLGQGVAPERALGGGATGVAQVELARLGVDLQQPFADEPRDHLADRRRAHAHALREPRRDDRLPLPVHVADRHEVLGGGLGRLAVAAALCAIRRF